MAAAGAAGLLFAIALTGPLYLLYSHFFRDVPMGGGAFLSSHGESDSDLNRRNVQAQQRADKFIRRYLWPIPVGAAIGAGVLLALS